jgi:hypothetical protein
VVTVALLELGFEDKEVVDAGLRCFARALTAGSTAAVESNCREEEAKEPLRSRAEGIILLYYSIARQSEYEMG